VKALSKNPSYHKQIIAKRQGLGSGGWGLGVSKEKESESRSQNDTTSKKQVPIILADISTVQELSETRWKIVIYLKYYIKLKSLIPVI
jgi:hypothetical protein